jgi:peroxiredoxin
VGVSFGSPEDHLEWATAESFQYELWSDEDRKLSLAYGAAETDSDWFPDRETFLLNREGNLVLEYVDNVNTATSPYEVLDDCTFLFGQE